MDLWRCEKCNCTITNFVNHRCLYHEYSYHGAGFENPDSIFGNNLQEIPATISHSAVGAEFNSSQFMNRTTTFQFSTFPQIADKKRHWDVNSTTSTGVRHASRNAVQNKNFDYFSSSQSSLISAAQYFQNSACTSGVENLKMPFFNAAYTSELNPVEVPWTNNIELMQRYPNLSFYNQLPPNSPGPSNGLIKYDLTEENFNIWRSMESGKTGMPDFKISRFQEKKYDAVEITGNSNRTEKNKSCASHLNSASMNEQYHGNPRTEESRHMIISQHVSPGTSTAMTEKFHEGIPNIQNGAYCNFENRHSYSIPNFGQGLLDRQLGMDEIPHFSNKSQGQFDDKIKFQNIFQYPFYGNFFFYQRYLNGQESPLNSSNVPIKCNTCNEMLKLTEKRQTCPKIAEYCENFSAPKVPKKRNPLGKRFPYVFTESIRLIEASRKFSITISETSLKKSLQQFRISAEGADFNSSQFMNRTSTFQYCNVSMNIQSGQSAMQDCEISRFQDKEYDGMAIARKSDRREENMKCSSDLSSTSINVQYHGNSRPQKSCHTAALKHASTITRENEFFNMHNSGYHNMEKSDSYSIPGFGQGVLDSRQGMKEIPHYSYKSQGQFADKMKFQDVFQCHFCGSYQRNLKGRKLLVNSSNVPFKCNVCMEKMKFKEKI
ncbi:hypothetical protein CDAR_532501 [Caerostris darwini]|uniref:C2H2-type domain-containing protein n=1 Tax=Caerostris darwini TaxID=1538125 RepID=A0AAV4VLZ4_9ARAC|nr:hypothetical protein CDAR_532501 [Caerostris darwini]